MFGLEGLPALWLLLLGVVWALYLGLGGADLGASMLLRRFEDRAAVLRANGPTWQANDVWLVIAVAATFGAFPGWYAAWTSGLYGVVLVIILALIVRHAGVELVGHVSGRAVAALDLGDRAVRVGDRVGWGVVWAWMLEGALTWATVLCGVALALVCRVAGAAFLAGRVDERVTVRREPAVLVAIVAGVALGEPWLLVIGAALVLTLVPRLSLWASGVGRGAAPAVRPGGGVAVRGRHRPARGGRGRLHADDHDRPRRGLPAR